MPNTDKILAAAGQEFAQRGYAASSLSAIAGHLGLTKGALVRKFPTKADLARGVIATLRAVIEDKRVEANAVYPQSGLRQLMHFIYSVGTHTKDNRQLQAAIVLFTDRTSPVFEGLDIYTDWTTALSSFLRNAQKANEIDTSRDARELAEYIFLINTGEAVFQPRRYTGPQLQTLHFLRLALRGLGAREIDMITTEVIESASNA